MSKMNQILEGKTGQLGFVLSLIMLPAFVLSLYRTLVLEPNILAAASVTLMQVLVTYAGWARSLTGDQRSRLISLALMILSVHILLRLNDVGFATIAAILSGILLFVNATRRRMLVALVPMCVLFVVFLIVNSSPSIEQFLILFGGAGAFVTLLTMMNSIQQSDNRNQQLAAQTLDILDYSVESIRLGIAELLDDSAVSQNRIAKAMFALNEEASLSLNYLITHVAPKDKSSLIDAIAESKKGMPSKLECCFTINQSVRWFAITLKKIPYNNSTEHITITVLDITDLKRREHQLLDEQRKTEFAMRSAGCGFWQYDSETGFSTWDSQLFTIWGLDEGAPPSEELGQYWINSLYPDDKARVLSSEQAFIRENKVGASMIHTYRIVHPRLGVRWIEASCMITEKGGANQGVLAGMSRDVTDHYEIVNELEQQQAQMDLALQTADISLFELDIETDKLSLVKGVHPVFNDSSVDVLSHMKRYIKSPVDWDIYTQTLHTDNASTIIKVLYDGQQDPSWTKVVTGKQYLDKGVKKRLLVREDVSELYQINSELVEKAERQKHMFAVIGHELRTPVAAIDMLLADGEMYSDEKLSLIHSTNDGLLNVLEDLRFIVNPEKALEKKLDVDDPAVLIKRTLSPLMAMSRDHEMEIVLDLPSEAVQARFAAQSLRQVITNLSKNALLYSGGSQLKVSMVYKALNADTVDLSIIVSDNGKGVPEETLESLFEPFVRGDSEHDGTGLGLSIVRNLINDMEGTLQSRTAQGGGLEFSIDLTLKRAHVDKVIAPHELDLSGVSVLLAEDDGVIRMLTERALKGMGAHVVSVVNGEEAFAEAQNNEYDLVITDLMMPKMNGDELTQKLRSIAFDQPIVCATAAVIGSETDQLLQMGVDQVISKPMTQEKLSGALKGLNVKKLVA